MTGIGWCYILSFKKNNKRRHRKMNWKEKVFPITTSLKRRKNIKGRRTINYCNDFNGRAIVLISDKKKMYLWSKITSYTCHININMFDEFEGKKMTLYGGVEGGGA